MEELINIGTPTLALIVSIIGVYFRLQTLAKRTQERLDDFIDRTDQNFQDLKERRREDKEHLEKEIDDLGKRLDYITVEFNDIYRNQKRK